MMNREIYPPHTGASVWFRPILHSGLFCIRACFVFKPLLHWPRRCLSACEEPARHAGKRRIVFAACAKARLRHAPGRFCHKRAAGEASCFPAGVWSGRPAMPGLVFQQGGYSSCRCSGIQGSMCTRTSVTSGPLSRRAFSTALATACPCLTLMPPSTMTCMSTWMPAPRVRVRTA